MALSTAPAEIDRGHVIIVLDKELSYTDETLGVTPAEQMITADVIYLNLKTGIIAPLPGRNISPYMLSSKEDDDTTKMLVELFKNKRENDSRKEMRQFARTHVCGEEKIMTAYESANNEPVDVTVLVDTIGGNLQVMNRVMHLMNLAKDKGGTATVYAGIQAASAGAQILMHPCSVKNRITMPETSLMWHIPQNVRVSGISYEDIEADLSQQDIEEWDTLKRTLIKNTRARLRKTMEQKLEDIENKEARLTHREVRISGREGAQLGLVTMTRTLLSSFLNQTGMNMQEFREHLGGTRIDTFFQKSALHSLLRQLRKVVTVTP